MGLFHFLAATTENSCRVDKLPCKCRELRWQEPQSVQSFLGGQIFGPKWPEEPRRRAVGPCEECPVRGPRISWEEFPTILHRAQWGSEEAQDRSEHTSADTWNFMKTCQRSTSQTELNRSRLRALQTRSPHGKNSTTSGAQCCRQPGGPPGGPPAAVGASQGLCALVAVSTLPPGDSRGAVHAPEVCWGQQQNSPKSGSLNPKNPVSPWPEHLGEDTSHQGCRCSSGGALTGKPQPQPQVCPTVMWSWPAAVRKKPWETLKPAEFRCA